MSISGADNLMILVRTALLDALDALEDHSDSIIVVGAQAVYLHTGSALVALAESTTDSDLAINGLTLAGDPLINEAMIAAGIEPHKDANRVGTYVTGSGIEVDLLVPEGINQGPGRRAAVVSPHPRTSMRRALGLEAALVDNAPMDIPSLDPNDNRSVRARVAGPSALIVAKMHKISERLSDSKRRSDKDAHDVYRMLVACPTDELADVLARLADDAIAGEATRRALQILDELFASSPQAPGSTMAGRAETGVGDPALVSAQTQALSEDLMGAFRNRNHMDSPQ